MPWDMHRLKVREWQLIMDASHHAEPGAAEGLPAGWEHLPLEEG